MKKPEIRALILAAGESSRTSTPKMLLPFGSMTLIERVIENTLSSDISGVTVILGAWQDELMSAIRHLNVSLVINEDFKKGMLSSVIRGIKSLPAGTDAAFIIPGDHPFIPGSLLDGMAEAYKQSGKGIIIPVVGGKRGHPLLADVKYFGEIEKLDANVGLRALADKFSRDVYEYPAEDKMILFDIDTLEDYDRAIKKYNNYGKENQLYP